MSVFLVGGSAVDTNEVETEGSKTGAVLESDFLHQVKGVLVPLLNNIGEQRRGNSMIVTMMVTMTTL